MANSRLCSIPDCGKSHYANGYCSSHNHRFRKHGDPLGGRAPNGESLRFIHEVAIFHTGDECLAWPFCKISDGYGTIRIDGKAAYAHRYICELVRGTPPTPEHEAAHSCGKGHEGCISPIHLDWKTTAQNQADRLEHGTHNRGERHGLSKLVEAEAREIIALKGVETQRKLAKRFGVSQPTISEIHAGKKWAWLS
jgi:hypothetical protein